MNSGFQLADKPMSVSTAITSCFKLWWSTLGSVILFSSISGFLSMLPALFQPVESSGTPNLTPDIKTILIGIVVALINIIPNNAVFAKVIHASHNTPINSSQAMAVALTKYVQVLLFMLLLVVIFGIPFAGIGELQNLFSVDNQTKSIWALIIAVLFLTYFIVFLTIGVYWTLTIPILISENINFISAMKKSFSLIKQGWWYTGAVLSVPFLVGALAQVLLRSLIGKFSIVIGQAIFMPLNVAVLVVLYEHHKMRSGNIEHYVRD